MELRHRYTRGVKLSVFVTAFVLSGLLASATAAVPVGTPEAGEPNEGGEWIVGITELPDTLDPHKTGAAVTQAIMRNVCDPLIAKNFQGEYVPGLAREWTVAADGLTWTFTLRDDVTFQDGTPFDAAAVKTNFDRILDPDFESALARSLLGPMESTAAPDEYTFQFTLGEAFAPLLDNLTNSGALCMLSPAAIQESEEDLGRTPVSTGPFMVEEYVTGDRVVLKRYADYAWAPPFLHQGGPAYIETLTFRSIIEEAARIAAFEAGEIQQTGIPSPDVERIVESGDYWIVDYLRKGVVFLEFNVTKPPFDDLRVRQAFNHAINKQDVMDAAVEGYGQIAYGFLPPSIFGYWPGIEEYAPTYDPEQATALLAEAGWIDSDGDGTLDKEGEPFEFVAYNLTNDAWNRAAQVIQSQLADIGIAMEIQQYEFATLLDKAKAGEHSAEFMGYTYTEPDIAYLWFHSSNIGTGLNMSHIDDPTLDDLIVKARSTMDLEARAQVYEELQKYIVDQALWVPLWIDTYYTAYDKSIHGAEFHPDAYTVYFDAWIE